MSENTESAPVRAKRMKWTYLGDGVYAALDAGGVWLHANHHEEPTDAIYLEFSVCRALARLLEDA